MKLLVHLLTALLIVPNSALAKAIQADYFDLAKEQNYAHFIIEPKLLTDVCSLAELNNSKVVRVAGGYFEEKTLTAIYARLG